MARYTVRVVTAPLCLLSCLAWAGCDDDAPRDSIADAAVASDAGRTPDAAATDAAGEAMRTDAAVALDADVLSDATSMHDDAGDDAGIDAGRELGAGAPRKTRVSLVDQIAWTLVDAADDPFDDRPAHPPCEDTGYGAEEFSTEIAYSIDTARCTYLTATQATVDEVRAGEEVFVRVWHFPLSGPDGAEAHVALTLDGITLLDEHIAIPADGGLLLARWTAPKAILAGAPVFLHVHNHGANQYAFLELSSGVPE